MGHQRGHTTQLEKTARNGGFFCRHFIEMHSPSQGPELFSSGLADVVPPVFRVRDPRSRIVSLHTTVDAFDQFKMATQMFIFVHKVRFTGKWCQRGNGVRGNGVRYLLSASLSLVPSCSACVYQS